MAKQKERKDIQEINDLYKDARDFSKENFGFLSKIFEVEKDIVGVLKEKTADGKVRKNLSKEKAKNLLDDLKTNKKIRDAVGEQAPMVMNIAKSAKKSVDNFKMMATSGLGMLGIAAALVKAFVAFQKAVTDTRKELGVSYITAVSITAQNKVLAQVAKGYGLDIADITSAQASIREDLGASVQESINLSLGFARTAAATGQTSKELSGTLSIMESISGASRDVLLNQIRTNAAMIEAAGVAPSLVMKDIAQNAEFFASFAKDGGKNLIGAGTAARKLGLSMSTVKGVTESLLEFETSIESSMEASLLLGRQINTDKARQLAFTGDQEGLMKEIQRLAGGEAEFAKSTYIQRQSLAKALGMSVEELARTVRNNTAGATGAAAGSAAARGQSTQSSDTRTHELLGKLVRIMD